MQHVYMYFGHPELQLLGRSTVVLDNYPSLLHFRGAVEFSII